MPANASVSFSSPSTKYVKSVGYANVDTLNGTITATAQGDANLSGTVTLKAKLDAIGGNLTWTCQTGTLPSKALPASCQ